MTFVSSVHYPKIMLGVLVKVLCRHSITTRRRLPSEGNVTFEDLMRVASDFDVRTVTIKGLTSVRYLLSVTVGIVTVIAPIWSAGLFWSHDACAFEERLDRYPVRAYRDASGRNPEVSRRFSIQRPALLRRHARWGRPYFQQFFGALPREAGLIGAVSLFKFRRIKHLVVAAITELVVHRALPLMSGFEKRVSLTGDRGFESFSLRQRVYRRVLDDDRRKECRRWRRLS
jgi:hypothetical protein